MGNSCSYSPPCSAPAPFRTSSKDGGPRLARPSNSPSAPSGRRSPRAELFVSETGGAAGNASSSRLVNQAFQSQELFSSTSVLDNRQQSSTAGDPDSGSAVMAGALDVYENQMSTTHFTEQDTVKSVLSRGSWGSSRIPEDSTTDGISFVILGAKSSRALEKILPCLLKLFETSLIDQKGSNFIAVGLDDFTEEKYREMVSEHLSPSSKKKEFLAKLRYCKANCTLAVELRKVPVTSSGRVLYFVSLPSSSRGQPVTLDSVMQAINDCPHTNSWTKVVLQGSELSTYQVENLRFILGEERVFRIDPFAGSDACRRLVALRFGNRILEPTWNRNHIRAVLFDFALDPLQSREHSDQDFLKKVFVDHLLSLVALVAMERPSSRFGDDVRDAKAVVLSTIQVVRQDRFVLGICENEQGKPASATPTFATVVFDLDTNRWRGVPFIVRVGKNMDRTRSEVRVLFRTAAGADVLWKDQGMALKDNELTIRVVPSENAMLDLVSNLPGLDTKLKNNRSTLDFHSQAGPYVPEPFDRLVYDAMRGRRANFVRRDCLLEANRILAPLFSSNTLAALNNNVHTYSYASRLGPQAADDLIMKTIVGSLTTSPSLSMSRNHASQSHNASMPSMPTIICPWVGSAFNLDDVWSRATDFGYAREMQLSLRINFDQMRLLLKAFTKEMENGLKRNPSTLKMLETYVTKLPQGSEEGIYYALDLGGTNFRVVKFQFQLDRDPIKLEEVTERIPDDCKVASSPEPLFDFMAGLIHRVISKNGSQDIVARFGFTFSFPLQQETLTEGRLITWTKGWNVAGMVNNQVTKLLEEALSRKGINGKIDALINDTVGTLAAKCDKYAPLLRIGVILGTGTNAAFLNVDKETGKQQVINMEWGGFGSFGKISALPFTHVDHAIDAESPNPGEQWFEKMISGYYLGEITRRWMLLLHENGELWTSCEKIDRSKLGVAFRFDSKYMSDVELDLSDGLEMIRDIEETILGVKGSTLTDRILVRNVCRTVVERAARLTACALAAVINWVKQPGVVVGVDGSLFEAHASFKQRLVHALDYLGCHCSLVLSKDGSGLGAALVAAAAGRQDLS